MFKPKTDIKLGAFEGNKVEPPLQKKTRRRETTIKGIQRRRVNDSAVFDPRNTNLKEDIETFIKKKKERISIEFDKGYRIKPESPYRIAKKIALRKEELNKNEYYS